MKQTKHDSQKKKLHFIVNFLIKTCIVYKMFVYLQCNIITKSINLILKSYEYIYENIRLQTYFFR